MIEIKAGFLKCEQTYSQYGERTFFERWLSIKNIDTLNDYVHDIHGNLVVIHVYSQEDDYWVRGATCEELLIALEEARNDQN
jgi:hypothetical protein